MISKTKVATTTEKDADKIVAIANKLGVDVYKGSVDNVLERFYMAAVSENPDYVVRLTSDCPLIDPDEIDLSEIDEQVEAFEEKIYHSKLADKKELHFGKKWLKKTNLRKELFNSKKALQKSIIVKEVLDKPLALRR